MKIIVPMAGRGKRFDDYLSPKPLIDIEGKPMIEHAISFLPKDYPFIFLCDEEHLRNTNMKKILQNIVPNKKIIGVTVPNPPKGPCHSSLFAFDDINDDEEILVTYCDTIQVLDFDDFLKRIRQVKPDGALFSFKGFHPASLGETYYGYMRVDENGFLQEIREKQSFTPDRTNEFASSGIYYFSSGKIFKKYIKELISDEKNCVNGEFYMSLPFNLMIRDGLKILNYQIEKFISLGIARDYELYKFWSEFFLKHSHSKISFDNINLNMTNVFPLAGGEHSFKDFNFYGPNFALPIMNRPLIYHAFKSNPRGIKNIFIGLKDDEEAFRDLSIFNEPDSEVLLLHEKTKGNAETIYQIRDKIDLDAPICISGATQILQYDEKKMANLMEKKDVDVILFSFSHHECVLRNPDDFAYFKVKNNIEVEKIIEKQKISETPFFDQAFAGISIFRHAGDLFEAIEEGMKKSEGKKLYYSECLNNILSKKRAVIFEIDKFISLRTVEDFKEFLYWQDFFDKLKHHPYSKEK
jgi:NDP-sugar pyrophosphorylase family protein